MTTPPARNGNRFAFTIVTALFFLWGFISCMNDLLIPKFKADFNLNQAQANLVQFAFFGAYFLVSLAYFLISAAKGDPINKIGYKNGLVLGLLVAGVGCFLFYPAAETKQYSLFLGALIVLGAGITIIQIAANPYVTILGPEETGPSRLNLSQGLNSLGYVITPLIGGILLFGSKNIYTSSGGVDAVKLPYVGVGHRLCDPRRHFQADLAAGLQPGGQDRGWREGVPPQTFCLGLAGDFFLRWQRGDRRQVGVGGDAGRRRDDEGSNAPAMTLREIREISHEILSGLAAAHDAGIVHRDLKPANVMLTHRGAIVMDFGVAGFDSPGEAEPKPNPAEARSLVRTEAGTIFGSPAYMAPELWEGAPATVQSDLYSFGVMLYQMLSGRLPIEAPNAKVFLVKLREEKPTPVRQLRKDTPWTLALLVARCMRTEPEKRPVSAAVAANLVSPLRLRRRWIAAGVLVTAAAVSAAYLLRGVHEDPQTALGLPDRVAVADHQQHRRRLAVGQIDRLGKGMQGPVDIAFT